MTLREKQSVFTYHQSLLIQEFYRRGFQLTFGEAARPRSQVLLNFYGYNVVVAEAGLSLIKTVPTSKTLDSRHPDRLAVDYNILFNGRLLFKPDPVLSKEENRKRYIADLELVRPVGEYWVSLNTDNVWGGDFNRNKILDENFIDAYHFECKP